MLNHSALGSDVTLENCLVWADFINSKGLPSSYSISCGLDTRSSTYNLIQAKSTNQGGLAKLCTINKQLKNCIQIYIAAYKFNIMICFVVLMFPIYIFLNLFFYSYYRVLRAGILLLALTKPTLKSLPLTDSLT